MKTEVRPRKPENRGRKILFSSLFYVFCILSSVLFGDGAYTGGATFHVLELPFGARGAAMGGAFCGLANDVTAIWWNPAGLAQLSRGETHFCHQEWFQSFRDEYGGVGVPTYFGVLGGSFLYSSSTGIEGYSEENEPKGKFKTYEAVLSFAYAKKLRQRLYLGLSLQGLYQNLDPRIYGLFWDRGKAIASNFGMLWRVPLLGVGISLQNIGTAVRYAWKSHEYLPRTLKMGVSVFPTDNFTGVFDINIPQFGKTSYHFGGEYWLREDFLSLRAGYTAGILSREYFSLLDAISVGFGIKLKDIGARYYREFGDFELDYAYSGYGDLGMTHRINLTWVFGPRVKAKTGDIVVRVLDAETKKPLQAIITTDGTLIDTAITSPSDGKAVFREVPIGMVYVSVQKDFYVPKADTLWLEWYETRKTEIALEYVGPPGIPHEKAVKGIVGRILGPEKEAVAGIIHYEGPETSTVVTDDEGWYTITDIKPGNYTLEIESKEHKYFPHVIEDVIVEEGKTILAHCALSKVKILRLYFERDRAYVHPHEFETLDKMADFMLRYKENLFEIHGHTDPRPPKRFRNNEELSHARAKAVADYLVRKGVSEDRLSIKGWGAEKPIAPNDTEEGMALNRRIEIIIKPPR